MTALFILGLVIVLTVILTLVAQILVSAARAKYKIIAPKTVGNDNFERAFRAHQNQLEANSLFIPLAFLQFFVLSELPSTVVYGKIDYYLISIVLPLFLFSPNLAWLIGRSLYIYGYNVNASKVKFIGGVSSGIALILIIIMVIIGLILPFTTFYPR